VGTARKKVNSAAALQSYRERLTPVQIERVRELTADVSKHYYRQSEGLE